MWEINIPAIGACATNFHGRLFFHLWEKMDEQTQRVDVVGLPRSLVDGVSRKTIWQGFKKLEALGLIRRRPGSKSWSVVYINPAIVHPHWLRGTRLQISIDQFRKDPSNG